MNRNNIMGRCDACARGDSAKPGCWEDEARGVYAEQMKEFHNISRETSDTHRFGSFIAAANRDGEGFTFCAEWSFDDASFTGASLKIERGIIERDIIERATT